MRAVEFIKKFGWEKARLAVKGLLPMHEGYPVFDYNSDDLKRYIDAYELVESYGGLDIANAVNYDEFISDDIVNEINQAITLVEECQ